MSRFLYLWALLVLIGPAAAMAQSGDVGANALTGGAARSQSGTASPVQSSAQSAGSGLLNILEQTLGGNQAGEEFLDPEVAFVFDAAAGNAETLTAHWEIADGYYLYRDKLTFELRNSRGMTIRETDLPAGKYKEDEFFGRMEVYYDELTATLRLDRGSMLQAGATELAVGYQGCADLGLCYPPMTKVVNLELPAAGLATAYAQDAQSTPERPATTGPEDVGFVSEQDSLASSLAAGSVWIVLPTFFGLGLLLAFTPCVLPMVPILSSIIVGQGEKLTAGRGFMLSLVYVLAMAATYTVAGVLAGLFGANLQAAFQAPWVLITFSIVFVLLSLSMFGLYDLQIPATVQTRLSNLSGRQRGGTYAGVAVMGLLSALIVGPCVAAPLAGALIYIGKTGDAVLGGSALFFLSMGMGAPLLVVGGSAGKLLPHVGPWMDRVKVAFGFMLLAVAVYLLERIVPSWVAMLMWAALLIYAAIYMGALDALEAAASGWRRMWKATGLIALTYGVLLMVGAASGGDDVFRPLKGLGTLAGGETASQPVVFKRVKGKEALEAELLQARARGQTAMLDFYADWCVSCKELEKYTFSDPSVQAALAETLWLQTDVTLNDEQDKMLLESLGIFGPPAVLFYGPDGLEKRDYRLVGFVDAEEFLDHVRLVFSDHST